MDFLCFARKSDPPGVSTGRVEKTKNMIMWDDVTDDDTDDDDSIIQHSCSLIAKAAAFAGRRRFARRRLVPGRHGRKARWRERRSVSEIFTGLGPDYFRRAYRMRYRSFWKLSDKLKEGIEEARSSILIQNVRR